MHFSWHAFRLVALENKINLLQPDIFHGMLLGFKRLKDFKFVSYIYVNVLKSMLRINKIKIYSLKLSSTRQFLRKVYHRFSYNLFSVHWPPFKEKS